MAGKRIFITGGGSGLGRAVALRYAREGWRVAIGDVHVARLAQVRGEIAAAGAEALDVVCDVRDEASLQAAADTLVKQWGGVDVVVNNAGVALGGAIEDVPLDDWRWIIDINLLGVVRGCRVFTPVFARQGRGHFVNVASMAGLLDVPYMSAYNASKAAVISVSETLENELRDRGIKVTVVCPSFFKTNLGDSFRTPDPRFRTVMDKLCERSAVTAEDIADGIYLAVDRGRFYVLPHTEGTFAWRMKRFLPRGLYRRVMARQTRGLRPRGPKG